jgi:hypothetical protein
MCDPDLKRNILVTRPALRTIGDAPAPLVVVGYNFTQDAIKVLQDTRAPLFAVSNFGLDI